MLVSLAHEGQAFKLFGWTTKNGVPLPALVVTLCISFFSFLTAVWGTGVTFTWLLNITGILALLQWIAIAVVNLRFRYAFKKQGRSLTDLPFKAPAAPLLASLVIVLGCVSEFGTDQG